MGYFSFRGRISRAQFWRQYVLPMTAAYFVAFGIDVLVDDSVPVALSVYCLLMIVPSLAGCVKRCHDRGRSGWFFLISMVPLLSCWFVIETYSLRGTVGPNRFGPDPLSP